MNCELITIYLCIYLDRADLRVEVVVFDSSALLELDFDVAFVDADLAVARLPFPVTDSLHFFSSHLSQNQSPFGMDFKPTSSRKYSLSHLQHNNRYKIEKYIN